MASSFRGRTLRNWIRGIAACLPFSLDVQGRRRDRCLSIADLLVGTDGGAAEIELPQGPLLVDLDHPNERLLAAFFHNLLRGQRRSPLGRHVASLEVPPGSLFVDVGANLGLCSLHARDCGFETLLFEPEPRHHAFLARNAPLYGRVEGLALSDHAGKASFFVGAQSNPGSSSLVGVEGKPEASGYAAEIEVELRRFDEWIPSSDLDPTGIRFVKIDVEGNEEATVRGFTAFLEEGHRPEFWCEVRGPSSGRARDSWKSVKELLDPFGYEALLPDDDGNLRPFVAEDGTHPQVFDLLFRP